MTIKYIERETALNGAPYLYHGAAGAFALGGVVNVMIHSWSDEAALVSEAPPDVKWRVALDAPFDDTNPEQALLDHPQSPFLGGVLRTAPSPSETPELLRARKNAAINASRLAANQSHFTFAGKQIATDPLSRSDIDGAHGMIVATGALPPGWPGAWKAMDNTYVLIPDVATWMQFYGTMVATGVANFNHSQALKAQLAAAQTIAEIEAVPDW